MASKASDSREWRIVLLVQTVGSLGGDEAEHLCAHIEDTLLLHAKVKERFWISVARVDDIERTG